MMTVIACRSSVRAAPLYGSKLRFRCEAVTQMVVTSRLDIRLKSTRPDLNRDSEIDSTNSLLKYTAITDWFVQLRWKAANMLTASLSDTERQELLRRMNLPTATTAAPDQDEKDVNTKATHSIAEAVAAARAQEIKLNQERWEREKEKLIRDAEVAARERIESDILLQRRQIAFEQWKKQLATAEEEKQKKQADPQSSVMEAVKVADEVNSVDNSTEDEELPPHPILGQCVLDLGYKRLHVVKAQALAAIPVWEKQRIYRHDRAKTMAADKLKTLHLGMPGVIGLYEQSDGTLSILDGQHRVGMFTILEGMKKDSSNSFLDRIVVEVYTKLENENSSGPASNDDSAHARDIFLEINKAEPVKLVDIPGIVKSSERKILNDAVQQLHDEYHDMFRPSTKCHPPHLNLDNVRDAIFAANVMGRHKIKSSKQLFDWLVQQNVVLSNKYKPDAPNGHAEINDRGLSPKALEKAIKNGFYLGLESSWYYN
jgi:hypothetical protein